MELLLDRFSASAGVITAVTTLTHAFGEQVTPPSLLKFATGELAIPVTQEPYTDRIANKHIFFLWLLLNPIQSIPI